jgi:hypothetical protein
MLALRPAILLPIAAHAAALFAAERSASLNPSQERFISGEPIDLVLTLHNSTDATCIILPTYPVFYDYARKGGVAINAKGAQPRPPDVFDKLVAQFGRPRGPASWGLEGKFPLWQIERGKSHSTKLFLQQFALDPAPGDYEVTYVIDIHPEPDRQGGEVGSSFRGEGKFRISIVKGSDAELSAALARHSESRDNYWSIKEMVEGLVLVKSPAAIPYLTQIPTGGSNKVILAMSRFKGDHDAESFVLEKLHSDDEKEILAALAVLQEWNYSLPEDEVRRLLYLPDTIRQARLGTILYAASLQNGAYHSLVATLINDSDASIAETARRALSESSK